MEEHIPGISFLNKDEMAFTAKGIVGYTIQYYSGELCSLNYFGSRYSDIYTDNKDYIEWVTNDIIRVKFLS